MRRKDEERRSDFKRRPRAKAAALYVSGWTVEEIAADLGVGYTRAHRYLRDMNVKMRPRGRPKTRRK